MSNRHREPGLAVVTGVSSGIGNATARALAAAGFHVLGGVRREADAAAIRQDGIEPVMLDITDARQVAALAARVADDPERRPLHALVNNAGRPMNVPVELFPVDEWRRLFEVNFFGHVAVTQALLPALVAGAGRIVNLSSVGGRIAMPTFGPYSSTKFALEAVSDALRQELAAQGVAVIVIEPGSVRTAMLDRASSETRQLAASLNPDQRRRYGRLIDAVAAQTAASAKWGATPEDAARVIVKALTARRPRPRYTVGLDSALVAAFSRLLPDRAKDWVNATALRPYRRKDGPADGTD